MEIVRNPDGTLLVPVQPERKHPTDDPDGDATASTEAKTAQVEPEPTTRLLHPGEGGYDEALAEWDRQQNPDREPVVSTASGRQEAMTLVHAVAVSPDHAVAPAVEALDDPEASGEALRHVLVGGGTRWRTSPKRSQQPKVASRFPPTKPPRSSVRSSKNSIDR